MRVLLGLLVGLAVTLSGPAAPAGAAPGASVALDPAVAHPGGTVTITGGCGAGAQTATVSSNAFPTPIPMIAVNAVLTAHTTIPAGTAAQGYTVTLNCPGGGPTATTTLWVVTVVATGGQTGSTPSPSPSVAATVHGPATGGGGTAGTAGGLILAAGVAALSAGLVLAVRRRA